MSVIRVSGCVLRGVCVFFIRVCHVGVCLCFVFNAICSKVIDPATLDELENEVVVVLCQMEMYFPSSFFDIMVHLIVHLVREIWFCGHVFYGGCIQLSGT